MEEGRNRGQEEKKNGRKGEQEGKKEKRREVDREEGDMRERREGAGEPQVNMWVVVVVKLARELMSKNNNNNNKKRESEDTASVKNTVQGWVGPHPLRRPTFVSCSRGPFAVNEVDVKLLKSPNWNMKQITQMTINRLTKSLVSNIILRPFQTLK